MLKVLFNVLIIIVIINDVMKKFTEIVFKIKL